MLVWSESRITACLRSCQPYVNDKQHFRKEDSDCCCSLSLTNVPSCFLSVSRSLQNRCGIAEVEESVTWTGICQMLKTINLLLLKAGTVWVNGEGSGVWLPGLTWLHVWAAKLILNIQSSSYFLICCVLMWANFSGIVCALLLSKCQHKPVGKISAFESEQHVQICANLFAVTAMQEERPTDFLVVLAPAVSGQQGWKGGGRKSPLIVWLNMKELMM